MVRHTTAAFDQAYPSTAKEDSLAATSSSIEEVAVDNHIQVVVATCTAEEAFQAVAGTSFATTEASQHQAVAYTSTTEACLVTASSWAADQDNLALVDPVVACKAFIMVAACLDFVASSSGLQETTQP